MYYIVLSKFWWKYAKNQGYLKNNGKNGIKFIKSKRIGLFSRIWGTIKESLNDHR
jgi:hypothetical protein